MVDDMSEEMKNFVFYILSIIIICLLFLIIYNFIGV